MTSKSITGVRSHPINGNNGTARRNRFDSSIVSSEDDELEMEEEEGVSWM
jgi:hypothetical protein